MLVVGLDRRETSSGELIASGSARPQVLQMFWRLLQVGQPPLREEISGAGSLLQLTGFALVSQHITSQPCASQFPQFGLSPQRAVMSPCSASSRISWP